MKEMIYETVMAFINLKMDEDTKVNGKGINYFFKPKLINLFI